MHILHVIITPIVHMQMIDDNGIYSIVESDCVVNILWIPYTDFDKFGKYLSGGSREFHLDHFLLSEQNLISFLVLMKR